MKTEARSSFFERKEAKKLLGRYRAGVARARVTAPFSRSFLLLFFKKEGLALVPRP
jgi:hypothetical protein